MSRERHFAIINTPNRKRKWDPQFVVTICQSRQEVLEGAGLAAVVEGPIDLVVGGPHYVVAEWIYPDPKRLWALNRRRYDDDGMPLPLGPGQWVITSFGNGMNYGIAWREGNEWRAALYPWFAERIPPGEWRGRTRTAAVEALWSACIASGDIAFDWTKKYRTEEP
jgi:hypothetical protein